MTDPDIPDDEDTPTEHGRELTPGQSKTARLMQAQAILEKYLAGVAPVYLCREFGVSRATLFRRIAEARDFVLDPTVEQYRADAVARLNMARLAAVESLQMTRDPQQVAPLVGRLVQIEETEAKLRGAYAPTKVEHRVIVEDAFARLMQELNDRPATQETHTHA